MKLVLDITFKLSLQDAWMIKQTNSNQNNTTHTLSPLHPPRASNLKK